MPALVSPTPQPSLVVHELAVGGPESEKRLRRAKELRFAGVEHTVVRPGADGFWTVRTEDEHVVRAGKIEHTIATFG
jgi:sugar/nucleoside kinase (ribokinase family)